MHPLIPAARPGARAFALIFALGSPALAAQPPSRPAVGAVTVTAPRGVLTQAGLPQQRAEVLSTAGSVGFIDAESLQGRYAATLRDVLKDTPGVFVQTRYGQELRLSVRGSGIARGYHLRGLEVLQDGVPWNMADGSGDFYEIDPLSLRSAEVYKGGNGLQYGASTLGGAVNFVTPTARTVVAPNLLKLEGGGFATFRASATVSRAAASRDGLATLTYNRADGSRAHSASRDLFLNGNLGYRFNDAVETRLYLSVDDTRQQMPGALTLSQALADPGQAAYASAAPVAGGNQQRNVQVQRLSDRTSVQLPAGRLDLEAWAYHKHLYHPIFQVIAQDGWTWGGGLRYRGEASLAGLRNEIIVGGRLVGGLNHARQYVNVAGRKVGGPTAKADQRALNLDGYLEDRLFVRPGLALVGGLKAFSERRELDNLLAPARSGDVTFRGLNPRVGVLWQASPSLQLFADATRSQDVPDFSDLAQTNTSGPSFVPLRTQRAWTYEAGARGAVGPVRLDVTLYRADLRGELLQFTVDPNVPAATFNAGHTVHQGVELAAAVDVLGDADMPDMGQVLTLSALWNLNDFRFRGDPQYGENRIAGAPANVIRLKARYQAPSFLGLRNAYLSPQLDWVPQGAWADQSNSLRVPGYAVWGVEAGFDLGRRASLYLEGRNLGNEAYVSDISTVICATPGAGACPAAANPAATSAIFYPGDRRAVFGGLRLAF